MRKIIIPFICLLLMFSIVEAKEKNLLVLSRDSTVMVVSKSGNSKGTGFFIDNRHIITCFHVVVSLSVKGKTVHWNVYNDLEIILPSGEIINGSLISVPNQNDQTPLLQDFAIVKLYSKPTSHYQTVALASDKKHLDVGDDMLFSGYPLATPGMVTHRGMVSGFDKSGSIIFVQASINKGNSGGALLDNQGEVVGIVSMREGGISQGLGELKVHIDKTSKSGSVRLMGVDPLQATKSIIQTLDKYISTGIGYARSIKFVRKYISKYPELMN